MFYVDIQLCKEIDLFVSEGVRGEYLQPSNYFSHKCRLLSVFLTTAYFGIKNSIPNCPIKY